MANLFCNFIKTGDLQPCQSRIHRRFGVPAEEHVYCGVHAPVKARLPPHVAGRCEFHSAPLGPPTWCPNEAAAGDRLCPFHTGVRERRGNTLALARAREAEIREAQRQVVLANREAERAAAPPVAAPLQRLAQDQQNVHTAHVTKQTSEGEEKLLSVKTDGRQVGLRVLRSFAARSGSLTRVLHVANDVEYWYNQPTCRRVGDRLYARVLEGLWALIEQQPQEQRAELKIRLWEEASESVGMCCEGHISRLVNVMVGFDEAFQPRMSVGESIQAKMAELAGKADLSAAEKVAQARAFLTELAVSAEEQAPWLEALE